MKTDSHLASALEPSQLTAATSLALPRRELGRGLVALLVALRVYIVLAVLVVIYAFVHALLTPSS